jgi:hypothetical protein
MISCLLIQVTRNSQGLPISKNSVIAGETLQIGRGAACKIHLQDHRISLLHATILRSEDGGLYVDAENNVTLKVDGFITLSADLQPGTRLEVGPYSLVVEPVSDQYDITLTLELIHPLPTVMQGHQPVNLTALGWSKRKFGFGMAAIILFLYFLLPLLPSLSPALDRWQADLPVTLTGAWSPGPLTGGHELFASKCSTCHQRVFGAVSDEVCTGCHARVSRHLTKADQEVKAFGRMRCTNCHIDHKGRDELVLHDSSKCVDCHGNIKDKKTSIALDNVRDFSTAHPAFHLTFGSGDSVLHIPENDKVRLIEKSGLKYSHQVHLAKDGVSSPQGDTVMHCQDCHKLEESGKHFAPMTMQKSCQQSGCHALDFTDPVIGLAPHGSERAVMNSLREFYGKWLGESADNRAVCKSSVIQECANELARKNAAATLFRKDLECGECHEITPVANKDVPWKVTPIHINRDWQPGAIFAHDRHDTMKCTDCHDKVNSKVSADISMPGIAKCRECHVGNHPARGRVVSGCDSCHQFHRSEVHAGS